MNRFRIEISSLSLEERDRMDDRQLLERLGV